MAEGRLFRVPRTIAIAVFGLLIAAWPPAAPAVAAQTDLDAFMGEVLARRDDNWKKLQQYILTEKEAVDLRGLGGLPIWGDKREYNWFLKDGFFVRSPTKVNGVTLSDAERRKAEDEYLKRAKEREKRNPARGGQRAGAPADAASTPKDVESLIKQTRDPEFVSSAYFLRFKFEQGKYALVGHEPFEGRDTVRIEYYPARLFSHEQDAQQKRAEEKKTDREKDMDAAIETAMNKVSLVTIWVEPATFQIVKYTFDNVSLDFLPGASLFRMNDLRASMTMSKPYPEVWLPRDIELNAGVMVAVGQFDVKYRLDYTDYKLAEISVRIKTPGAPTRGVR